jgi:hypothetical protein
LHLNALGVCRAIAAADAAGTSTSSTSAEVATVTKADDCDEAVWREYEAVVSECGHNVSLPSRKCQVSATLSSTSPAAAAAAAAAADDGPEGLNLLTWKKY